MTNNKSNQIIHEAMGLCWHGYGREVNLLSIGERNYFSGDWCDICKTPAGGKIPDYTSDWSAWGKALEWAMEKEWWRDFITWSFLAENMSHDYILDIIAVLLSCEEGSTALAEFITKHPDYFKKEVGK